VWLGHGHCRRLRTLLRARGSAFFGRAGRMFCCVPLARQAPALPFALFSIRFDWPSRFGAGLLRVIDTSRSFLKDVRPAGTMAAQWCGSALMSSALGSRDRSRPHSGRLTWRGRMVVRRGVLASSLAANAVTGNHDHCRSREHVSGTLRELGSRCLINVEPASCGPCWEMLRGVSGFALVWRLLFGWYCADLHLSP